MIISSWNVNSVRARIKNITDYIKKNSPDILMIQEIKTEEINFPFDEFNKLKYESYVFGQKSYNGVAILSKNKIQSISTNLINDNFKQSRIISGDISAAFLPCVIRWCAAIASPNFSDKLCPLSLVSSIIFDKCKYAFEGIHPR